jgi:hypothetical protein
MATSQQQAALEAAQRVLRVAAESAESLRRAAACPLCGGIDEGGQSSLPCGHSFCAACLRESLRVEKTCPRCKTKASQRDVRKAVAMENIIYSYHRITAVLAKHGARVQPTSQSDEVNNGSGRRMRPAT